MAEQMSSTSSYQEIHALLIRWKDDEDGVIEEMDQLGEVLERFYDAKVDSFDIPSFSSEEALVARLQSFTQMYSKEGNLLIVYYAGHGCVVDGQKTLTLVATSSFQSLTLNWHESQVHLQQAAADVLILLNTCYAAASTGSLPSPLGETSGGGITELIAACGFEGKVYLKGPWSFIKGLIEELVTMTEFSSFEIGALHHRLVSRLFRHGEYPNGQLRTGQAPIASLTPIHICLNKNTNQRNISLRPIRKANERTWRLLKRRMPVSERVLHLAHALAAELTSMDD